MDCLFSIDNSSFITHHSSLFRIDVGHNELNDCRVSIAVNSEGKIGILDNQKFVELPDLGRIEFSDISSKNQHISTSAHQHISISDKQEQLKWYHLKLRGDYLADKPSVDVSISEKNSMKLKKSVKHLSHWVNDAPAVNSVPSMVNFCINSCKVIVDEVVFK
jgi:hypothetical protein